MQTNLIRIASGVIAAMLLLCLFHMPWGYYVFVRYAAMIIFAILAVNYFEKKQTVLTVVFASLAILFQPFIKFALGRTMWNVVDVICAVLLIALIVKELNSKHKT